MGERKLVDEWMVKAEEDLEFANSVIEETGFYAQICFHYHQSAEKYLKAVLIALDLEFQKIHDLPVLLKSCATKEPDLLRLLDDCKFLNRFYIEARYPVHWPTKYTKKEAFEARAAAENIRSAVETLLQSGQ